MCNLKETFTHSSHRAIRNLFFISAKQISEIYQFTNLQCTVDLLLYHHHRIVLVFIYMSLTV